jgi:hypothetical protein
MKPWIILCGLILAISWQLLTLRVFLLPILLGGFLFLLPSFRDYRKTFIALVLVSLVYPLNPLQVTLRNVPGGPKIVGHCNIRADGGWEQVLANQSEGKCVVADDLRSELGVTPSRYVVW